MNGIDQDYTNEEKQTLKFLASIFGATYHTTEDEVSLYLSAEPPIGKNQPEFWADTPWRIEEKQDEIPILLLTRETNITHPAKGPWQLDVLKVQYKKADQTWEVLRAFRPADLPNVDINGNFELRTWTYSIKIPLSEFTGIKRGDVVQLRVVFSGSFSPHEKPSRIDVHLQTYLAEHALPLSRTAHKDQARHWFYGDTHYHSVYTNDIKELGNPVKESRDAAHAVGMDWLVITDHSCDLDDVDADISPQERWDRLKDDVVNPQITNKDFRCILGEEITLVGKGETYVHMLAFGSMDKLVEGAFLPYKGGFMTKLFQAGIEKWLENAAKNGGYPPFAAKRLFGKVHPLADVMNELPTDTLTFAAHPYNIAQPPPPGKWDSEDLEHPDLTGYEFWNGRSRRSTHLTLNPFAKIEWDDPDELVKRDEKRIKKLRKWVEEKWEMALRRGLKDWDVGNELPDQRPVFIAGSDAHGSFNYSVGLSWDYRRRLIVDDNAIGRVRTAVLMPHPYTNEVPPEGDILAAVKKGSCVVTDGPIIDFSLEHNGVTAGLGEVLVTSDDGDINVEIRAFSTPEFGTVEEVELVTCFRAHRKAIRTIVRKGDQKTILPDGSQGYARIFAQTHGLDGELFCCFSNPIWIRITDGKEPELKVKFG